MSKLLIRELTETKDLDQSSMKKVLGGLVYIFSSETLRTLGKSEATVSARKAEEEALELAKGHHQ